MLLSLVHITALALAFVMFRCIQQVTLHVQEQPPVPSADQQQNSGALSTDGASDQTSEHSLTGMLPELNGAYFSTHIFLRHKRICLHTASIAAYSLSVLTCKSICLIA